MEPLLGARVVSAPLDMMLIIVWRPPAHQIGVFSVAKSPFR
jgi:hypothetical protein